MWFSVPESRYKTGIGQKPTEKPMCVVDKNSGGVTERQIWGTEKE
jgi:hypothetical protein